MNPEQSTSSTTSTGKPDGHAASGSTTNPTDTQTQGPAEALYDRFTDRPRGLGRYSFALKVKENSLGRDFDLPPMRTSGAIG